MVSIQLDEGFLDIYTQDIEWTWETIRFSEGIRDQFSTDMEIPKTENNLHLLDVAGLLDSTTQPLGIQIAPCVMNFGDNVMDVYLQVVSVREEDITICVFEKTLPNNILDTSIAKYVTDDDNSIFAWNVNTRNAYPNDFKTYWYGMAYNTNYAQLHPSKDLNEVIQRVNAGAGMNMPLSPSQKYVLASKKTICPQNHVQVIEGHWEDNGNFAVLSGGQHITNDCEFSYSPDSTTITFNRNCKVSGKIYFSFKKKGYVTNSFPLYVCRYKQGEPVVAPSFNMISNVAESVVDWGTFQFSMTEGCELRVMCNNTNKYEMLDFVIVLSITDYVINDDDYGIELKYIGRTPRIKVYSNDGLFKFGDNPWQDMVDGSGGGYTYCWFDGTTYKTHFGLTGSIYGGEDTFTLEWCSLAYFGYWCNIPDIKVKELLWGLCWTDGKKLSFTTEQNMWMLEKTLLYKDANDTAVIDGWISETRLSSDRLGKDNYILSNGQDEEHAEPVSHIENQWLENTRKIHESPFSYAPWRYGYWYCIDQYSDAEYDEETGEYKCKFSDVDGFTLADAGSVQTLLYRLDFNKMGFDRMSQSVEVDIHTMNDVKNLDFVFLNGRKYMVIDGSRDFKTGESTLTALLVPYSQSQIEPDHDYPQEDENHWDDDHEPSYPYDPNDDFNPDDDHSDYDDPDDHDPEWKLAKKEVTSITCRTDQYGNTGMADETRTATYIDTNKYSDSYKRTKTVDETVVVYDPQSCPVNTDPIWRNDGETMTGYECLTDAYGNTGQCVKTYTTVLEDVNPRSATYGTTTTRTRTETVTDNQLCPAYEYRNKYFTVTNRGTGEGAFRLISIGSRSVTISVSSDNGSTWQSQSGTRTVRIQPGGSLLVKHTGAMGSSSLDAVAIYMSSRYEVSGNIASLCFGDDFNNGTKTMPDYAFTRLFSDQNTNDNLISAENLYFGDFTAVSTHGMSRMFSGCSNIEKLPNLSSITSVGDYGLLCVFSACSSAVSAPDLTNITSAGTWGIFSAFENCSSLTTAYAPNITWDTQKSLGWLNNVSSTGTLYAKSSMIDTIPANSTSGCPRGWTKTAI